MHANELQQRWQQWRQNKCRDPYPIKSNHVSQMGHPCLRYLVHRRLDWKIVPPWSWEMVTLFDEGHTHEERLVRDLLDMGLKVSTGQQYRVWDEDSEISGYMDLVIESASPRVACEVKSMSHYAFQGVNKAEDFGQSDRYYHLNYVAQLRLYVGMGLRDYPEMAEHGIFVLKDKQNGQLKFLELKHNEEIFQGLLAKGRDIREFSERNEYPVPRPGQYCSDCPFIDKLCQPQQVSEGIPALDIPRIGTCLDVRAQAEPHKKLWAAMDKEIKAALGECGETTVIAGDWVCSLTGKKRKTWKFKRIGGNNGDND